MVSSMLNLIPAAPNFLMASSGEPTWYPKAFSFWPAPCCANVKWKLSSRAPPPVIPLVGSLPSFHTPVDDWVLPFWVKLTFVPSNVPLYWFPFWSTKLPFLSLLISVAVKVEVVVWLPLASVVVAGGPPFAFV